MWIPQLTSTNALYQVPAYADGTFFGLMFQPSKLSDARLQHADTADAADTAADPALDRGAMT
jgi:hypothetical protein